MHWYRNMIQVVREIHQVPHAVQERVARAGGNNRYGEPNFRVVWGGSRLTWIGGRWTDHDASGNVIRQKFELRQVPKYVPVDRWHIERWIPPEFYGPYELWYARTTETNNGIGIPSLGPFPSRGEYEHCFTIQSAAREFLPLTPAACDHIVRAIEWSRGKTRGDCWEAIRAREARNARECDRVTDDVLSDVL
jgi:hypothetical protein